MTEYMACFEIPSISIGVRRIGPPGLWAQIFVRHSRRQKLNQLSEQSDCCLTNSSRQLQMRTNSGSLLTLTI
jgi:hypothetical protein